MSHLLQTWQRRITKVTKRTSRSNTAQRFDYLMGICRGKRVLHFGCADYPLTEEKLSLRALLYAEIAKVAQAQIGVDNSVEGIELLRRYGYRDLYVADAESLLECVPSEDRHFELPPDNWTRGGDRDGVL